MDQAHTMQTRDLVMTIERAMREGRAAALGATQRWGVAFTKGERDGTDVIMATTLGGERLPLTTALIMELRWVVLCIQGSTLCVLDPPRALPEDRNEPLQAAELHCAIARDYADRTAYTWVPTTITPELLSHTRLVLTAPKRAPGWPP